jgi:hypothetical protein
MSATREITILVPDTIGQGPLNEEYRGNLHKYGQCDFEFVAPAGERASRQHPHAGLCFWRAGSQNYRLDTRLEVLFGRCMGPEGRGLPGMWDLIFGYWSDFGPDIIGLPSGYPDQDEELIDLWLRARFDKAFLRRWDKQMEEHPAEVYFAAGNSGDYDPDPDVDYPQRLLHAEHVHCIGAADRGGVPAKWSGDSPQVDCMYRGVQMSSRHPFTGQWFFWDGTSGTCFGAMEASIVKDYWGEDVKTYWRNHARRYAGMKEEINRKGGRGWMGHEEDDNLRMTGLYPHIDVDPRCLVSVPEESIA